MPLIISIETSTKVCSVALHQNGKLLACHELLTEKSHSGMLTTLIQNVVKQTGYALEQIDAFAVAKGPGSYTGLRIGVSTAKGLCFALDKPLVAINTLEAMAYQFKDFFTENHLLCPMIDARRMEVYCTVFDTQMNVIEPTQAKIIDDSSFTELLAKKKVVFFGDGAAKCQTKLGQYHNSVFVETDVYPTAKTVGFLAVEVFKNQQFEDLPTFEPYYLKDFVSTSKNTK